SSCSVRLPRHR
ncbi:hypothetical protein BN1723_020383, partial [Verticillium longisporum]